ncbi:MAG: hypothetical protein M3Y21_06460 [Candidatus Eremiobacteraeota bacterium]|nr:hypothetical protein [Candidatus Eremiobacteraeota bacterium]
MNRSFLVLIACAALLVVLAVPESLRAAPSAAGQAPASPTPQELLVEVRNVFRSHRPPPPFETYQIERKQDTQFGYPDFVSSYKYNVWIRNVDKAALQRHVFRGDYRGPLEFNRPAFNNAREGAEELEDPGPPTADLFEPAPVHPRSVDFVPTPEPSFTPLRVIATVKSRVHDDYTVTKVSTEGDELHLSVIPYRNPDRNRLRELYVDKKTLELQKVVATDKLFVEGDKTYAVMFTLDMQMLDGVPIVTHIHGSVDRTYVGDGEDIDYYFRNVTFPKSLPDWYFDPHTYAAHQNDAPV